MASGKQVLISLLTEYSQRSTDEEDVELVTDRLKAGLLLHCSSAPETLRKVEKMSWLSDSSSEYEDYDGSVWRQGLGLAGSELFLSDFVDEIFNDPKILARIGTLFPTLTERDHLDAVDIVKWLFTSLEYFAGLGSVENNGKLDAADKERLIHTYRQMLKHYREDENYMY